MAEKGTILGYTFTVTTHKFEITATILITNISLIRTAQLMEIGCQGVRKWKNIGDHCCRGWQKTVLTCYQVPSDIFPTRCNITQFISGKLLYMFRVVSPPIIRSTHNCIYSIWYLSNRSCYLPLLWKSWNCSVNTVVCAPDDWWR